MNDEISDHGSERENVSNMNSHNDFKTNKPCLDNTNLRKKTSSKTENVSGYHRTTTLRVPLKIQNFLLEPASVNRRNTLNVPRREKVTINSVISTMKTIAWNITPILTLLIFYFFYTYITQPYSGTCDMKKAENRDFNKFYGIEDLRNHFTITAADACDSDIIFKSVLPQAVLKSDHSASSFMILAKYGTGKTLLRCEYFKSLKSNNYFKILILNKQINEYLERFVSGTSTDGRDCESRNCLVGWSKNEFAQLILSVLVTQFVDEFQKEELNLSDISLDEKVELISILCYYYNGQGVSKLEKLINFLLKKTNDSMYSARKAESKILERNVYQDKPVLTHLKEDLNQCSILRKDYDKLHLLLAIIEGEGFQNKVVENTMFGNVFNHLTHVTMFIKTHLKKSVVFVIDGIDENRYFFKEDVVNKLSLELFLRSSVSQEILSSVMAHNFYLSLFYPEIDGINIQDAIIPNGKLPTYTTEWNKNSLINYADYVLQKMNHNASAMRCKSFPDFKTLVNYTNQQSAAIIDRISTPRALHYFMEKLITEMNNCANDSTEPFIATFENVANAFKKSIDVSNLHHVIRRSEE